MLVAMLLVVVAVILSVSPCSVGAVSWVVLPVPRPNAVRSAAVPPEDQSLRGTRVKDE